MAVLAGFDWVFYADNDYCRVSVIPDGKNSMYTQDSVCSKAL